MKITMDAEKEASSKSGILIGAAMLATLAYLYTGWSAVGSFEAGLLMSISSLVSGLYWRYFLNLNPDTNYKMKEMVLLDRSGAVKLDVVGYEFPNCALFVTFVHAYAAFIWGFWGFKGGDYTFIAWYMPHILAALAVSALLASGEIVTRHYYDRNLDLERKWLKRQRFVAVTFSAALVAATIANLSVVYLAVIAVCGLVCGSVLNMLFRINCGEKKRSLTMQRRLRGGLMVSGAAVFFYFLSYLMLGWRANSGAGVIVLAVIFIGSLLIAPILVRMEALREVSDAETTRRLYELNARKEGGNAIRGSNINHDVSEEELGEFIDANRREIMSSCLDDNGNVSIKMVTDLFLARNG